MTFRVSLKRLVAALVSGAIAHEPLRYGLGALGPAWTAGHWTRALAFRALETLLHPLDFLIAADACDVALL